MPFVTSFIAFLLGSRSPSIMIFYHSSNASDCVASDYFLFFLHTFAFIFFASCFRSDNCSLYIHQCQDAPKTNFEGVLQALKPINCSVSICSAILSPLNDHCKQFQTESHYDGNAEINHHRKRAPIIRQGPVVTARHRESPFSKP